MEHFTAICCNGGEPFIDFHLNGSSYSEIDPTDWSADIIADFDKNSSTLAETIAKEGVGLDMCKLFNITFTNLADQFLFDAYKANFECRCPPDRSGQSCEFWAAPLALPLVDKSTPIQHNIPYTMILVLAAVVLAFMAVLMMMVKGCFCDCFGPMSREDPYDKPLDPEDVRQCLQKVRENKARREMASEPLVVHPPPLVADSYSAPYEQAPPTHPYPSAPQFPVNTTYRAPSPPPAYSETDRNPPMNYPTSQI